MRVLPEVAANEDKLRECVAREIGFEAREIEAVRVLRRSIDARQRIIQVNLKVRAYIRELPSEPEYARVEYGDVHGGKPVVVVGAGPGGLLCTGT